MATPAADNSEVPIVKAGDIRLGVAGWPCQFCGGTVPLDLENCSECGASFLAAAKSSISLVVPGIGDLTKLSKGARVALMAGGATVLTFVLYLVALVLGHLV
ncbi:MAG TPA: hypothetical protein VFT62_06625, partial [Mycobacteriales bacterium]|nr:hypothetical protein [Mycobacteriales bacterium]